MSSGLVHIYVTAYEDVKLSGDLGDKIAMLHEKSLGDGRRTEVKKAKARMEAFDSAMNKLSKVAFDEGVKVNALGLSL